MDLKLAATVSAMETAVILRKGELLGTPAVKLWLALLLAQYVVGKIYSVFIYPRFVSPLRHLPGPTDNHFSIGQMGRMMTAPTPHTLYQDWARKWPEEPFIRQLSIGNQELLIVNSLAAHKECVGTHGNDFVKAKSFEKMVGEILPGAVLFTKGEEHKRRRRLLAGPLSLAKVRRIVPVFQEKARGFAARLESELQAGGDGIWEVESNMSRLLLDIVGVAALGVELGQLESSTSMDFNESYHNQLQPSKIGAIIMFLNAFVPLRWLPIESNRKFLEASATIHGMIRGVVQQRAKELRAANDKGVGEGSDSSEKGRDILTYMLEESLSGGGGLTETEIAQSLFELVAAGHDTSASVVTFAIYELAAKPELQDRCRAEILANLTDADSVMVERLDFLNNFLREVMRVHSPTVNSVREAVKDMVIEGIPIAKGTTIVIAPAGIQRNPKVWGPNADDFDPDRWDRLEGDAASPYAFAAFNNGPRICPGKVQGMLQMKVVLAELIRAFRLEAVDALPGVQNPALVLKPDGPLRVKVRRLEP